MKTINEYLFSKKSDLDKIKKNRFGITQDDMIGDLKGFPVGIAVRMLEETENQGNNPDIKVFQKYKWTDLHDGGFRWGDTEAGYDFWQFLIANKNFTKFYQKYPEYKKYDL